MDMSQESRELQQLVATRVRRMNAGVLAVVAGVLAGLALFIMTNILVIKGAPEGQAVGPHLGLLGQFFPGYRVTFVGSLVGLCYAFVVGFVLVYVGAKIYTVVADLRGGKPRSAG
jgi:hypothetical protein